MRTLWFNAGGETPESIERTRQFGIASDRLFAEHHRRGLGTGDSLTLSSDGQDFIQSNSDGELMIEDDVQDEGLLQGDMLPIGDSELERIADIPEEGGTLERIAGIPEEGGTEMILPNYRDEALRYSQNNNSNSIMTPTVTGGGGSLGTGWGGQNITINPFYASNSPLTQRIKGGGGGGPQKRFPWLLVVGVLGAGFYYAYSKGLLKK